MRSPVGLSILSIRLSAYFLLLIVTVVVRHESQHDLSHSFLKKSTEDWREMVKCWLLMSFDIA